METGSQLAWLSGLTASYAYSFAEQQKEKP